MIVSYEISVVLTRTGQVLAEERLTLDGRW